MSKTLNLPIRVVFKMNYPHVTYMVSMMNYPHVTYMISKLNYPHVTLANNNYLARSYLM